MAPIQQVQAMQPQMNQGMLPIPPFHTQMYQQNPHFNCKKYFSLIEYWIEQLVE